jgi:hypothetical protein
VRVDVQLAKCSILTNEPLEVSILGLTNPDDVTGISLLLFEVDDVETFWRSSPGSASPTVINGIAQVSVLHGIDSNGVFEVRRIEVQSPSASIELLGGRDFDRAFFTISDKQQSCEEVQDQAYEIEARRQIEFNKVLGRPDASNEYRVLSIVARCLITRRFQFPGFSVQPLEIQGLAGMEGQFVNELLSQNGWITRLDLNRWVQENVRRSPLVAFHAPRIRADSREQAGEILIEFRNRVSDILSLHRGAAPVPMVTVVERLENAVNEAFVPEGWLLEAPTYPGNLLGGFISGESPHTLLRHERATRTDPLLSLWTAIYNDAANEKRIDFAFFRLWNLLEGISQERVPVGQSVTNFDGTTLMLGNNSATTSSARPRVFQLLKDWLTTRQVTEQSFTMARPSDDLWSSTRIWYGYRNAAAHYGGFVASSPVQQQQSWYQTVLDADNRARSVAAHFDVQSHPFLRDLKEAASSVLHWELDAAGAR